MTLASLSWPPTPFPCSLLDQRSLHIHSNPTSSPLSQHAGRHIRGLLMLHWPVPRMALVLQSLSHRVNLVTVWSYPSQALSPDHIPVRSPRFQGTPQYPPKRVDICGEAPGAPGATGRAGPWGQARQEDPWGPGKKPTGSAPMEATSQPPPSRLQMAAPHGLLSTSHLSASRLQH